MSGKPQIGIQFSNPVIYQIQVLGKVHQGIWDYFEGKIDHIEEDENGQVTTSLSVHVRDQTELSGLINLLYDRRHVLLLVKMSRLHHKETPSENSENMAPQQK